MTLITTAHPLRNLVIPLLLAAAAHAQPSLEDGFKNPPAQARPHTWWHWMNGNITRAGITADLEAMKKAGLGGAQIFNVSESIPEGPIVYNSDEWRSLVKFACDEAKRLGIELCIHDCAGWSSSGGPWVKPEHAMQTVVSTATTTPGGAKVSLALPQPRTNHNFYRDIAVLAYPTPKDAKARIPDINAKAMGESRYGQQPAMDAYPAEATVSRKDMIDLTSSFKDGKLDWDAPTPPASSAGGWTILRIGYTPTGAVNAPAPNSGRGLEVDKMSTEAFDAFWAGGMAPLLKVLGPGSALNNVLVDSYEVGSQSWTPRFREEFIKRRGYDPLLYLPTMTGQVVDSGEASERFLWDFRRTVGDLFRDNYYSHFAATCHANGLLASTEPYDGPFACAEVAKDADIVMGEFWINADANGGGAASTCKLASSVAHTHGKTIVGSESFTAFPEIGKWTNTPQTLKGIGDLMYTMGINRYIIHRYAHQPWTGVEPGMTMGQWGTHFERTTTWWNQGSAWLTYLARCQYLLQQGQFVADVCYFAGDTAPNNWTFAADLKAAGYDYDACGADVLGTMTVKDGRVVTPTGMSYKLLVLPDTTFMLPATARKVRDLVSAGATVLGPKPAKSPSLTDMGKGDAEVAAIATEVWGASTDPKVTEHAFGKGKVFWKGKPQDVLHAMEYMPDAMATFVEFQYGTILSSSSVAWIHRKTADADIYFVSNQKPYAQDIRTLALRATGSAPEIWHPETGLIEKPPVWATFRGFTVLALKLEAHGSAFIVLRSGSQPAGHIAGFTFHGPGQEDREPPDFAVTRAVYEAVDGAGSADVTKKIEELVMGGELTIPANNSTFGDPALNHVKRLRIELTINGEKKELTAPENGAIDLLPRPTDKPDAFRLGVTPQGTLEIISFQPGELSYQSTISDDSRKHVELKAAPPPITAIGPWSVSFQPNRGAPASITLDQLASLSKHADPGVRHFSGTAEYKTDITIPAGTLAANRVFHLNLGGVRDIAEVSLNGKPVGGTDGIWWHAPFESDVTAALKDGKNTLSIKVTNTWANRLIGDEQLPEDYEWAGKGPHDVGPLKNWPDWFDPRSPNPLAKRPVKDRLTFTTWHHYFKDSPLPDSGLLGPVVLRIGVRQELK